MKAFGRLHREVAEALLYRGSARVICTRCGRSYPAAVEDLTLYLAEGWPICCGRQVEMRLGEDMLG